MNPKLKNTIHLGCAVGLAIIAASIAGLITLTLIVTYPIETILGIIITSLAIGFFTTDTSNDYM